MTIPVQVGFISIVETHLNNTCFFVIYNHFSLLLKYPTMTAEIKKIIVFCALCFDARQQNILYKQSEKESTETLSVSRIHV